MLIFRIGWLSPMESLTYVDSCHTKVSLVYIYIYIYMAEFSSEWIYRVAISVFCKSLHIWIEVSVAVERVYVNNSNCDS